jgi:hypothetical protein
MISVVPRDPTPQFEAFLKTHHATKATSLLQDHLQSHQEANSQSDKLLDGLANLDPHIFDTAMALALHKYLWAKEVPTLNPDSIKDKIGIYHIAGARKMSMAWKKRVDQGCTLMRQENLQEVKSRRKKKITTN